MAKPFDRISGLIEALTRAGRGPAGPGRRGTTLADLLRRESGQPVPAQPEAADRLAEPAAALEDSPKPALDLPPMPSIQDLMPHLRKVEERPGAATFSQLGVIAGMGISSELSRLTSGQAGAILSARSYANDVIQQVVGRRGNYPGRAFVEASLVAFIITDQDLLRRAIQANDQWRVLPERQQRTIRKRGGPFLPADQPFRRVREEVNRLFRILEAAQGQG